MASQDRDKQEKEYKKKFEDLFQKLINQGTTKRDSIDNTIEFLADRGEFKALNELSKVTKAVIKQLNEDFKDSSEFEKILKKISSKVPKSVEYTELADSIEDLFANIPKRTFTDIQRESLLKRILLVKDLSTRVFEMAAVSSGSVTDINLANASVNEAVAKIKAYGIDIESFDSSSVSVINRLDSETVDAILNETAFVEKHAAELFSSTRVRAKAHVDFMKNRTLLQKLNSSVPDNLSALQSHLKGFDDSGNSLSSHAESLMGFLSQAIFSIATSAEQAKMESDSPDVGESLKKGNLINRLRKGVLSVAGKIQRDYSKFDQSLKLLAESLFGLIAFINIFTNILNYSSKVTSSVVEVFGTQTLNYDLALNDQQLAKTIAAINTDLNSINLKLAQTYDERVSGLASYVKSGGSLKEFSVKSRMGLETPFRDFLEPLDTAARIAPALGQSQDEVMGVLGQLNSSTRLTLGQIEDLLEQVRVGSIATSTPTSATLEALLSLSQEFSGILNTFHVNQPMLQKIAANTGFNEKQAARALSGALQAIKGLNFLDIPHIFTLAGFDLNNPEELRASVRDSLESLKTSMERDLAKASSPLDRDKIKAQLEAIGFYQHSLEKGDLYVSLLDIATNYPQALAGTYLKAIDGQIKLIYQQDYERVKGNTLSYLSAFKLAAQRLNIPEEFSDMLIASRFTESGKLKSGELNFNSIAAKIPQPKARKDVLEEASSAWLREIKSSKDQLNQASSLIKSSAFELAIASIAKLKNFLTEKFSFVMGLGIGGAVAAGLIGLTGLGIPVVLGAAAAAGVAGYIASSSLNLGYVENSKKWLTSLASKTNAAAAIVEASRRHVIPPALLAAIKVQETRDAEFIRDVDGHIGPFQFDIKSRGITAEQAYDMRFSADLAAKEIRSHYDNITRTARIRGFQMTEAEMFGIAGSAHLLQAVKVALRLKPGEKYSWRGRTFTSRLRDGASYREIHEEVNRFITEMSPENTQRGGGRTYFENVLLHMAHASEIPMFSGDGLSTQAVASKLAKSPQKGDAKEPEPVEAPTRKPSKFRAASDPESKSYRRLNVPKNATVPVDVQVNVAQNTAPKSLPEVKPLIDIQRVDSSKLIYSIPAENIGKVRESVNLNNSLVLSKTVSYRTLYAKNVNDIIRAWNEIVSSSE